MDQTTVLDNTERVTSLSPLWSCSHRYRLQYLWLYAHKCVENETREKEQKTQARSDFECDVSSNTVAHVETMGLQIKLARPGKKNNNHKTAHDDIKLYVYSNSEHKFKSQRVHIPKVS